MVEFNAENKEKVDIPSMPDASLELPPYQPEEEKSPPAGSETSQEEVSAIETQLNEAMIKGILNSVGHAGHLITGIEECEFDNDTESEPIARAWAPLVPKMSVQTLALVTTVGILIPKIAVIVYKIRQRRQDNGHEGYTGPSNTEDVTKIAKAQQQIEATKSGG